MKQAHILLLFKFPEYESEYFMAYTADQLDEAKRDGPNFKEMYPGVLYVSVVFVHLDEREDVLWHWNNPLAASLMKLVNSAGDAMYGLPIMSVSVDPAGSFFRKLKKKFSDSALALRPPSEEAFAAPLPSELKTYGGPRRSIRRGLRQRR